MTKDTPQLGSEWIRERDGELREKKAVILGNGAKIVLLATDREMIDHFTYSDGAQNFRFIAYRWSEDLQVQDTWIVSLSLALKDIPLPSDDRLATDELRRITNNIAVALKAWPQAKLEAAVPLKGVKFQTVQQGSQTDDRFDIDF